MWSIKVASWIICVSFFIDLGSEAKTYYFRLNRTSNEYVIRGRLNPYNYTSGFQSGIQLSELRNRKKTLTEIQTHPLIDPEWNYKWQNITRPKLPTYISKYYEMFSKNISGTMRFVFNSKPQNSSIIRYNISNIDTSENISEVELHFFHKVDKNLLQKSLILRLYQMENDYVNKSTLVNPDAHKLLNVIYIYQAESGWQIFKLTNALRSWFTNRTDLLLFITISKPNEEQFSIFEDVNRDILRTFLVFKSGSSPNGFLHSDESNVHNSLCRKNDLHIDFDKLNWMKFIIAPSGYNAFNCYGTCYRNDDDLPNHVKVTNFVPEINRRPLCCTPTKYSPLPIMFYDKYGNVAIKLYQNMIISACSCR